MCFPTFTALHNSRLHITPLANRDLTASVTKKKRSTKFNIRRILLSRWSESTSGPDGWAAPVQHCQILVGTHSRLVRQTKASTRFSVTSKTLNCIFFCYKWLDVGTHRIVIPSSTLCHVHFIGSPAHQCKCTHLIGIDRHTLVISHQSNPFEVIGNRRFCRTCSCIPSTATTLSPPVENVFWPC